MRYLPSPRQLLSIAACALSLLGGAASQAQSTMVVGMQRIAMNDASRNRSVNSEVWFEAAAGTQAEQVYVLPVMEPFAMTANATPAAAERKPLIVLSHGNWATPSVYGWLTTALVQAGFVVLAPTHPGSMFQDLRPEYRARLWERSLDVSFALTQFLADPAWAARIDAKRIGFIGHSFGGWTGVNLAGGRYDFGLQIAYCQALVQKDQYCAGLIKDFNPQTQIEDGKRSYKDERFSAFYALASGMAAGFTPQSLKGITAPIVFETAKYDTVLATEGGSSLFARSIPSAKEIVREAGHFVYGPVCAPVVGKLVAGQVCDDPEGSDRKALHEQVKQDVVQFFRKQLML
jgi:predicted dienelactone hydrolase